MSIVGAVLIACGIFLGLHFLVRVLAVLRVGGTVYFVPAALSITLITIGVLVR